jgi:hypothetical protein
MTTVTGYLNQISDAAADSLVTVESAINPVVSGQKLQVPGRQSTKGRATDGYWQFILGFGSYRISVTGSTGQSASVLITVGAEHDGLTVSFDQLVVSALPTPQAPVGGAQPTASASVLGLVRTDETVAVPVLVTGIFWKSDIAAVRAIANASNNKLAFVSGTDDVWDWEAASIAADNSVTVLKPDDTLVGSAGRWKKRLSTGVIATDATVGSSVGVAETDLANLVIPAGILSATGEQLRFEGSGILAASANNKTVRVYLGATKIYDSGAMAAAATVDFVVRGTITRAGSASAQNCLVELRTSSGVGLTLDYTTNAVNMDNIQSLRVTGQGGADNEVQLGFIKLKFEGLS